MNCFSCLFNCPCLITETIYYFNATENSNILYRMNMATDTFISFSHSQTSDVCEQYYSVKTSINWLLKKKKGMMLNNMFSFIPLLGTFSGDTETAFGELPLGVKMPSKTHWEWTVDNMQQPGAPENDAKLKKKKIPKGCNCMILFIWYFWNTKLQKWRVA